MAAPLRAATGKVVALRVVEPADERRSELLAIWSRIGQEDQATLLEMARILDSTRDAGEDRDGFFPPHR